MSFLKWFVTGVMLFCVIAGNMRCSGKPSSNEKSAASFRNLGDSARYVGMHVCKQCHTGIHGTFERTGMGESFGKANRARSSAHFGKHDVVFDSLSGYSYFPYWKGDSLVFREFILNGGDTVFSREEQVTYIVGSGQHTNSHLVLNNGYIFQAPLTFYTQQGKWDLPPGFENGANSRFGRIIGLECISCHNAYPKFVEGSENKFLSVPDGIDCERCHGPGSIHLDEKQRGIFVDTSISVDYSIVNPAKLQVDLQFDVCQRCHLQGNAVLKEGKSFLDFRPGIRLSDVMDVYLPRYTNSTSDFIMASHADRLKQSACFREMETRHVSSNALRPYKSALTCVNCHNPHVSVKETSVASFNQKCESCHKAEKVNDCPELHGKISDLEKSCISCHMPLTGSSDIPHVSIHDHYIRKEYKESQNTGEKFISLSCINNPAPDKLSRIKAFLQQYERFNPDATFLLDSADVLINQQAEKSNMQIFKLKVLSDFLKEDYSSIVKNTFEKGISDLIYFNLGKRDYSNEDAWTAYRIGEAYSALGYEQIAFLFYGFSVKLAPYYFEFSNKFGTSALMNGYAEMAEEIFKGMLEENRNYAPAWSNLSYCSLLKSDFKKAIEYANRAIQLDYQYVLARLNKAAALQALGYRRELVSEIESILRIDPLNEPAQKLKEQLAIEKAI